MSSRLRLALIMPLALIASSLSTPGWAYDLDTHRAINDGAIIRSSLNDYLTGVLSLEDLRVHPPPVLRSSHQ